METRRHWKHFLWGFLGGFFFLQGLDFWQEIGSSWQAWLSLIAAAAFFAKMHVSLKRGE